MSKRYARQLHSADGLIAAVEQHGFLPFFRNEIHGFSIEELCPPELWFADDVDGPWEWKGPAARSGKCLYGKLFNKKAGFVSREWIPDFANFRRDGYDFRKIRLGSRTGDRQHRTFGRADYGRRHHGRSS